LAVGLHRDGLARVRLAAPVARRVPQSRVEPACLERRAGTYSQRSARPREGPCTVDPPARIQADLGGRGGKTLEIGRASCRGREEKWGGRVAIRKKNEDQHRRRTELE